MLTEIDSAYTWPFFVVVGALVTIFLIHLAESWHFHLIPESMI